MPKKSKSLKKSSKRENNIPRKSKSLKTSSKQKNNKKTRSYSKHKQSWEIGDDFDPMPRNSEKIPRMKKDISKMKKDREAATKIQSRLRGNIDRRKIRDDPIRGVPYRDTDWKSMDGLEIPWNVEKRILKKMIDPDDIDGITDKIYELQKDYYNDEKELDYLKKIEKTLLPKKKKEHKQTVDSITRDQMMRGEELQKLEKHLKEKKQLDLFQCNTIKNIIIADPNLGSDKDIQELIKPCKEEDINIWINAFYSLPWELFHPPVEEPHSIYSKIESYPNSIFTNYGKSMLRETLEDLELMNKNIMYNDRSRGEYETKYNLRHMLETDVVNISRTAGIPGPIESRGPMVRFELLSNYYRWSDYNRFVDLKHLQGKSYSIKYPYKKYPRLVNNRGDGRRELIQTLDLFEQKIRSRVTVDGFPIPDPIRYPEYKTFNNLEGKRLPWMVIIKIPFPEEYKDEEYLNIMIKVMKIHFLLSMMGLDNYQHFRKHIIHTIRKYKKMLPTSIENIESWIKYHYKKEDKKKEDEKEVHTKEKSWWCPQCSYKTSEQHYLTKHILKEHNKYKGPTLKDLRMMDSWSLEVLASDKGYPSSEIEKAFRKAVHGDKSGFIEMLAPPPSLGEDPTDIPVKKGGYEKYIQTVKKIREFEYILYSIKDNWKVYQ